MKNPLRTTVLIAANSGAIGTIYQPIVKYTGTGIKWYPEETKKSALKKK